MNALCITLIDTDEGVKVHADLRGESDRLIELANILLSHLHVLESHNPEALKVVRPTVSFTAH